MDKYIYHLRVWETRMWTCERWPCVKGRCQVITCHQVSKSNTFPCCFFFKWNDYESVFVLFLLVWLLESRWESTSLHCAGRDSHLCSDLHWHTRLMSHVLFKIICYFIDYTALLFIYFTLYIVIFQSGIKNLSRLIHNIIVLISK